MIKTPPIKAAGRKRLIASKCKVTVPMAGKSRQQELEAVDHATCVARREHAC